MYILVGNVTRSISWPRNLLVHYTRVAVYLYEVHTDNFESQLSLFHRLQATTGEYVRFVDLHFVTYTSETFGPSVVAGCVSEPLDVVSDFSFADKQSFLCRGWLASSELPPSHTDRQMDNCNFSIIIIIL